MPLLLACIALGLLGDWISDTALVVSVGARESNLVWTIEREEANRIAVKVMSVTHLDNSLIKTQQLRFFRSYICQLRTLMIPGVHILHIPPRRQRSQKDAERLQQVARQPLDLRSVYLSDRPIVILTRHDSRDQRTL